MKLLLRTICLRTCYWWHRLVTIFDWCPKCWATLNYTRHHKLCPRCNFRTLR